MKVGDPDWWRGNEDADDWHKCLACAYPHVVPGYDCPKCGHESLASAVRKSANRPVK